MTGAELQQRLDDLGVTQTDIAAHLDVGARTVRRWVSGDSPIPRTVELAMAFICNRKRTDLLPRRLW